MAYTAGWSNTCEKQSQEMESVPYLFYPVEPEQCAMMPVPKEHLTAGQPVVGYQAFFVQPSGQVLWPCPAQVALPGVFAVPASCGPEQHLLGGPMAAGGCLEAVSAPVQVQPMATCSIPAFGESGPALQTDCCAQGLAPALPAPSILVESEELTDAVIEQLEGHDPTCLSRIFAWLRQATLQLAVSLRGCRIVQKALEVAAGEDRTALVDQLRGHVRKLLESPHGNHVLQKCIEVMPADNLQFVVNELAAYPKGWAAIARHRFGCRVIERLLEHCSQEMTDLLMLAVIADAHTLCCHPFGNYVIQHVLEYGSKEHRSQVVSALLADDILALAQHRMASNVIQKALEHCGPKEQQAIGHAILSVPGSVLTLRCSRYGRHSVRQLIAVLPPMLREEALRQLSAGTPKHAKNQAPVQDSMLPAHEP